MIRQVFGQQTRGSKAGKSWAPQPSGSPFFSVKKCLVTVCKKSKSSSVAEQSCSRDLLPETSKYPANKVRERIKQQREREKDYSGFCLVFLKSYRYRQTQDPAPWSFLTCLKGLTAGTSLLLLRLTGTFERWRQVLRGLEKMKQDLQRRCSVIHVALALQPCTSQRYYMLFILYF